jgi:hypothetical protein
MVLQSKTIQLKEGIVHKILFIVKNQNEASSRFRVFAYWDELKKDFISDIFFAEYKNKYIPKFLRSLIKRIRFLYLLWIVSKYDVIFMQRPMSSDKDSGVFFEKLLVRLNPNLIFDFDDALFVQNPVKIDALIALSKLCICGNTYLAEYTRRINPNTVIIPTAIETRKFIAKDSKNSDLITIGWTGTSGNYAFFSNELKQALKNILSENRSVRFLFICDHRPDLSFDFPYDFIRWNPETEVADLQQIDIGLMPLEDSAWTKGKCGFKLIQYGAIGITSIASPIGVNPDVVLDTQSGYLTQNENWYELLNNLITNETLRKTMGENARKHINAHYSIQSNYPKLKDAILMGI